MATETNGAFRVRVATEADADAIGRVHIDTNRVAYRGVVPDEVLDSRNYEDSAARWGRIMASFPGRRGRMYVAEDGDGRVVAFAAGYPQPSDDTPTQGEVGVLMVLTEYQRRGIGRVLMRAVAEHLLGIGIGPVIVHTLRDTPQSRRFYERLGGQLVAEGTTTFWGPELGQVTYRWRNARELLAAASGGGDSA